MTKNILNYSKILFLDFCGIAICYLETIPEKDFLCDGQIECFGSRNFVEWIAAMEVCVELSEEEQRISEREGK